MTKTTIAVIIYSDQNSKLKCKRIYNEEELGAVICEVDPDVKNNPHYIVRGKNLETADCTGEK